MARTPDPARDADIVARYRAGETLQHIGTHYGLSRERVRQVVARQGVTSQEGGATERKRRWRLEQQAEREATCQRRWDLSCGEHRRLLELARRLHKQGVPIERTPPYAFRRQRQNAKLRGIPWKLSLGQWWRIWVESKKWHLRGLGAACYVMSRHNDQGAYEVGNVFIQTHSQNSLENITRVWTKARAGTGPTPGTRAA